MSVVLQILQISTLTAILRRTFPHPFYPQEAH